MSIAITEEHEALRDAVRSWVERHGGTACARGSLDGGDRLPDFWPGLASQGWTGLHIDEAYGGAGYGLLESAIVIEEFGRACLPGPFVPDALAAAIIQEAGSDALRDDVLADLASGAGHASVVLSATPLKASRDRRGLHVSGRARPVIAGAHARTLILAVEDESGERAWVALPTSDADVKSLDSVDLTRPVAEVTFAGYVVDDARLLRGLTSRRVLGVAATLLSAECAGIASWCLDATVEYAKTREQFGRPIGQFQAVKHRLADMLAQVEFARAAAWDAARAERDDPAQTDVASVLAAAVAPEAAYWCARQCVQLHGGIGYTWEHDAHLFLRRAMSLHQLLGGAMRWRSELTTQAMAGTHRRLALQLPPEADAHRTEARDFLESINGLDSTAGRGRMADAGYLMPHLAKPYGRGADAVEQLVIDEEFDAAGVERPFLRNASFVVPTLARFGTEAQQALIEPSLRGEIEWAQMFSEPEAGSDLASLRTKAVKVDGGWSITGQKIWTTRAHEADWAICLARTDAKAPKHRGITYFLVRMDADGIDIRPLIEITGRHHFNQIFLTEVFVPDEHVVGEVNEGWSVARATLGFERVTMGRGGIIGPLGERLISLIRDREALRTDPRVLERAGALLATSQVAGLLRLRSTMRAVEKAAPGAEASLVKLVVNENEQAIAEFGLELLGNDGLVGAGREGDWDHAVLYSRCLTIAGGTSEIQRNVVAQRVLGLPRDP